MSKDHRPRVVTITVGALLVLHALSLILIPFLVWLTRFPRQLEPVGIPAAVVLGQQLVTHCLALVAAFAMLRGRNWGCVLYLSTIAVALAALHAFTWSGRDFSLFLGRLAQIAFLFTIFMLLTTEQASKYFRGGAASQEEEPEDAQETIIAHPSRRRLRWLGLYLMAVIWVSVNAWMQKSYSTTPFTYVQMWCVYILNFIMFAVFGWVMGRHRRILVGMVCALLKALVWYLAPFYWSGSSMYAPFYGGARPIIWIDPDKSPLAMELFRPEEEPSISLEGLGHIAFR